MTKFNMHIHVSALAGVLQPKIIQTKKTDVIGNKYHPMIIPKHFDAAAGLIDDSRDDVNK